MPAAKTATLSGDRSIIDCCIYASIAKYANTSSEKIMPMPRDLSLQERQWRRMPPRMGMLWAADKR